MKLQRYFRYLKRFVCTAVLIAITDLHAGKVAVNQASNSVSVIPPPVSTQMSLADARFLVGNLEDGVGFGLYAYDINNSGQVVGNRWVLGVGLSGFIWQNGQYFADFPPTDSNHAFSQECYSISENGDVAGLSLGVSVYDPELSETTTPTDVAIWHRGSGGWAVTSLPKSVGNGVWIPLGLNSSSQGVGTVNEFVAVHYDSVTSNNLPNPYLNPGGPQSGAAYRINNFGVAVGYVGRSFGNYYSETRQACYWNTAGHHLLPSDGNEAVAFSINDIGQIVGYSNDGSLGAFGFGSPVLWDAGSKISLGQIIGEALDINKYGQIVGWGLNDSYEWRALLWDRLQPIDLNTRIPADSGWILSEARAINDSGMILCEGQYNGTPNFCVLTPYQASLAVDANRDGVIKLTSEDDSDVTTAEKPFRFWSNDDDDERVMRTWTTGSTYTENEHDDKEVTSDANKDCNNLVIDTERDLEDLARLWIYTAGITDALKNGTLRIGLKWTDVCSGTPAVRLFKAVEADGGNAYLFTPGMATLQVDQTAATGAHGMAVGSLVEGTNPLPLPTALFANLTESQPKTYLLFEGALAGKGQLKLVILDQNDQPIGEGPGVWIELKEPHEFVERYTCGDQSLGTVGALTHYTPSATFGAPTSEDEMDYVLYVHGYNMEDPEKQCWIETAFKRLYLLGYKGRVGGFSWPCAFGLVDQIRFDESEERAWQAGAPLQEHLQNLKNAGYRVHVIAHSQGNVVTGEALRLWRAAGKATALVNTYIASQAAVAAHSYNAAAPLMPDYDQTMPNVYAVYWRAGDSARFPQTWPATNPSYFADSIMQTTAGRWVNFYNPQDYALTAANGGIGSWESDQRMKPDSFYHWSVTNGFFKGLVPFETSYSFPDDRYTIFSFCAEARSVAVGANATGGVFGGNARNLQDFGYAAEHLWHSGQFRSFNAARYRYWQALMSACDLTPYNPN